MDPRKRSENLICLCPLCLSKGRNLYTLDGALGVLTVDLGIFKKENPRQTVCWECYAYIKSIVKFKNTALQALHVLQNKSLAEILNTNFSRLKIETTKTEVITAISKDMEKELEEKESTQPCLLTSMPLEPPSPLPTLPKQVMLQEDDITKLVRGAQKPLYIFVEKHKSAEKTALSKVVDLAKITKPNSKKYIHIDSTDPLFDNKTVLSVTKPLNGIPTTLYNLESMLTINSNKTNVSRPTNQTNHTSNTKCYETVSISDSESNKVQSDADSDHDTPLYLSYDDISDVENAGLRFDSETERNSSLKLITNDKSSNSFDSLTTIERTNNQDIEEQNAIEKPKKIENNLENGVKENTNYIILDTVGKEHQDNIISKTTREIDDADVHSYENITKQHNNYKDTTCNAQNIEKQETNVTIFADIINTTNDNVDRPVDLSDLENQFPKQIQENEIQPKASSALFVDKANGPAFETKNKNDGHNSSNDIIKCDYDIINRDILNCDHKSTYTEVNNRDINNTSSDVLKHKDNNTDAITLPRMQLTFDKIYPDLQSHATNIKLVDHVTNTNENIQKRDEDTCQIKRKQQLVINKITADNPRKNLSNNENTRNKSKAATLINRNTPKITLDNLKFSQIVLMDHCYATATEAMLIKIRRRISRRIYTEKRRNLCKPWASLTSEREAAVKVLDIKDLCAQVFNEYYANKSMTTPLLEERLSSSSRRLPAVDVISTTTYHENENTVNDMTDEAGNFKPDERIENVNMSVSIDMREFFPEMSVCAKGAITNDTKIENDSADRNGSFDYAVGQYGIEHEEINIKPEPIDCNELTDTASETDYYLENDKEDNDYCVPVQKETSNEIEKFVDYKNVIDNSSDKTTSKSNVKYTKENINTIILGRKYRNSSIELEYNVNYMLNDIKYDSHHLKYPENYLLEPVSVRNFLNETNSQIHTDNKNNSHKSTKVMPFKNIKRKRKRKAFVPIKRRTKTQNRHNADNENNSTLRLSRKRIQSHSNAEATMKKMKIDDKLSVNIDKQSDTNLYPNKKRVKKATQEIKENYTREKIDETCSPLPVVSSESNNNPKLFDTENDTNQTKVDEVTPIDKIIDNENNLCLVKGLLKDKILTKFDTISKKESSSETSVEAKDKYMKDNEKLLPHFKKDSQPIQEPGELNLEKLLLYPIVKLEKLDQYDEPRSEADKLNDMETVNQKTNGSEPNRINVFIENNKEITLDELEGEFAVVEANIEEVKLNTEFKEDIIYEASLYNAPQNDRISLKGICIARWTDESEDKALREKLKNDDIYRDAMFKCFPCTEIFSTDCLLRKHIATHKAVSAPGAKNYECNECTRIFHSHISLVTHIHAKHRRCYKCRWCDAKYISPLFIKVHVVRNHPQNLPNPFNKPHNDYGLRKEQLQKKNLTTSTEYSGFMGSYSDFLVNRVCLKNETSLTKNNVESTKNLTSFVDNKKSEKPVKDTIMPIPAEHGPCTKKKKNQPKKKCTSFMGNQRAGKLVRNTSSPIPAQYGPFSKKKYIQPKKNCTSFIENKKIIKKKMKPIKDTTYNCYVCNENYPSFDILLIHQKFRHILGLRNASNQPDTEIVKCFVCLRRFLSYSAMVSHQKRNHRKYMIVTKQYNSKKILPFSNVLAKKFACFICSERFESYCNLSKHQKYHVDVNNENDLSFTVNSLELMENNLSVTESSISTTEDKKPKTENLSIAENNLSITENNLSKVENQSTTETNPTLTESNLPVNDLSLMENNLLLRGDNLALTENNSSTAENISSTAQNMLTFSENNWFTMMNKIISTVNNTNLGSSRYKYVCFLCDKLYMTYQPLFNHQKDKHRLQKVQFQMDILG